MRMSKVALLHAIGAAAQLGCSALETSPRQHGAYSLPEFTPSKVDKKPNKVSQKKRRFKARRLGH